MDGARHMGDEQAANLLGSSPSGSTGWGWGRFPSRQRPYYETFNTRDEEMAQLKEEAAMLKGDLEAIEQRLSELEMQQER